MLRTTYENVYEFTHASIAPAVAPANLEDSLRFHRSIFANNTQLTTSGSVSPSEKPFYSVMLLITFVVEEAKSNLRKHEGVGKKRLGRG